MLSGFHEKLAKKQVAFRQWRFQHIWSLDLFDPKKRQEQQSKKVKWHSLQEWYIWESTCIHTEGKQRARIDLKGPHDVTKQQVKQIGRDYFWVLRVPKGPIGLINNPWGSPSPFKYLIYIAKVFFWCILCFLPNESSFILYYSMFFHVF